MDKECIIIIAAGILAVGAALLAVKGVRAAIGTEKVKSIINYLNGITGLAMLAVAAFGVNIIVQEQHATNTYITNNLPAGKGAEPTTEKDTVIILRYDTIVVVHKDTVTVVRHDTVFIPAGLRDEVKQVDDDAEKARKRLNEELKEQGSMN
ncbi:MAG: hypothetical protein LBR06_03670 [Bacteroidales bacterium]|jgi:hypothetical protein|nr:hypothetical protein [Bacteroidales bacterium]